MFLPWLNPAFRKIVLAQALLGLGVALCFGMAYGSALTFAWALFGALAAWLPGLSAMVFLQRTQSARHASALGPSPQLSLLSLLLAQLGKVGLSLLFLSSAILILAPWQGGQNHAVWALLLSFIVTLKGQLFLGRSVEKWAGAAGFAHARGQAR